MADEQRGAPGGHPAVFLVDVVLGNGVQRGGGFVQRQDRPVFVQRPRQHQPLGLPAGKFYAVLVHLAAQLGVQPVGQGAHRFGQAGLVQALPYPAGVDAVQPLGHVLGHAGLQHRKVLEHRREQRVVIPAVILPDVLPVQEHPPPGGVQEPAGQPHQRGLAGAVQAHDGQLFAGVDGQVDVVQGVCLGFRVAVAHMVKADLAGHIGGAGQRLAALKAERLRPVQRFPQQRDLQRLAVQLGAFGQNAGHPLGKAADRRKVQKKL